MFIPISLEYAYQRIAFATYGLLATIAGVAIFVGFADGEALMAYALRPREFALHQLITNLFLHGDVLHLLGNALFLWIFGRYVEDRLGAWRFLVVYLGCGLAGDLAYLAFSGGRPVIGASGAISGLMGYVLVAAPWLEVRCVLTFGTFYSRGYELAAGWLLIPWALFQVLEASLGDLSSVAASAHLGGFAAGVLGAAFMRSRRCEGTGWYIDPRPPRGGRATLERLDRARSRSR